MELKGLYFTAEDMQEIQNAFSDIQNVLVANGYSSPEISTESVGWNYLPNKIRGLFNNQELNTQKIDSVVDWINPYSAVFEWKESQGNIYSFINRWYKWFTYNQKIINNETPKTQWLFDIDGNPIMNNKEQQIITVESFFNKEE